MAMFYKADWVGPTVERAGAVRDAQTNAVANIEGAVTQAVFYDDVPAIVGPEALMLLALGGSRLRAK